MKKFIVGFTVVLFLFAGLYAGKYDDLKPMMDDTIKLFEGLSTSLENAKDENAVAAAFDKFTEGFKKMLPDMIKLSKKYPEMKDMQKNPPEELKEYNEKMKAATQKFMGAMMGAMGKYANSQVVKDAMTRMQTAQMEMQKAVQEAEKKK